MSFAVARFSSAFNNGFPELILDFIIGGRTVK